MFELYEGDLMGLTHDENYLVFRWSNSDCKILASITKRGDTAICHFASDKKGLRLIGCAIDDFIAFVREHFKWCNMLAGFISRPSVERLMVRFGFEKVATTSSGSSIYLRGLYG